MASRLLDAAKTAAWDLGLWGGAQVGALFFDQRPAALAVLQGALAEWGAGRLGVAWSDPVAAPPTTGAIARRVLRGAGLGTAAAVAVVLAALATHGATRGPVAPAPDASSLGMLVLSLIPAVAVAVRDELLLRGLVLRATRGLLPLWAAVLACGAAGAAARFGLDGALGAALLAEGLRAMALTTLWVRDRGAWMPWAANASWMWVTGAIARGGLVDLRFASEPDAGGAAIAVLAAAAALGGWWLRRQPDAP